jgi:hypothetical protein
MSIQGPDGEYEIGFAKPPASTQFRQGQSGNRRGRPKGRRNGAPYEAVLGQQATVSEHGQERQISAAEAFLLHVTKRGLEGDGPAARAAMAAIEKARSKTGGAQSETMLIIHRIIRPGAVNCALRALQMAVKLDRFRSTARMALEPWIVEAALERMGDQRLSLEEQAKVVKATRTPDKVRWPEWWSVR